MAHPDPRKFTEIGKLNQKMEKEDDILHEDKLIDLLNRSNIFCQEWVKISNCVNKFYIFLKAIMVYREEKTQKDQQRILMLLIRSLQYPETKKE